MAAVEVRPEPLFPDVRRAVFGTISTFTPMRQLHVTSPTSNIAAMFARFLANFFADLRKRGIKQST
jgi:hypothetical protein